MKKTRLKLKKQVWVVFGIIIFLGFSVFIGNKIYEDKKYKETYEYKLLEKGYTKEEIFLLNENLTNKEIDKLLLEPKNTFLLELFNESYYIKKNLEAYLEYHTKNSGYPVSKVVAYVNTNNNYAYYDHDLDTDTSKDYLMLVNKFYHLNKEYEPNDLVNISNKYYYGENHKIRKSVYDAFINMWEEAYKEDIYLIINSSYRTYESQQNVYDDYKNHHGTTYADEIAARPGYSEHQTGLALDIFSKDNISMSTFKDSPAHTWLINNAYKYGFIERYRDEKESITGFSSEAWHWRYVGDDVATYIHDTGITFDEYYAYFVEK